MWALSSQRSRVISGSRPAARAHVGRSTSIPALSRCSGIGSKGAAKGPELDPADLDQHVFCRPDSKPTHPQLLSAAFKKLVEAGHTLLVIEHNLDVIKTADYVIDLGPEGGDAGGRVIATGTPEQIVQVEASYTGQALRQVLAAGRTHAYATR